MAFQRLFAAILSLATFLICILNWGIGIYHPHFAQVASLDENTINSPLRDFILEQPGQQSKQRKDTEIDVNEYHKEPKPRPPLKSIVDGWNITGDTSWLLNYAIIGFPKCGTSTLMHHLESHPEISIFTDERCENSYNQHARLIEDLYVKLPPGDRVRAIKCPMDLENTQLGMRNYKKFFPKTDFLIGIRHPILWFESFYNFRIHNKFKMPSPEKLVGKCFKGFNGLCTYRSNFHIFLSNLGKTNNSDPKELQYMPQQFIKSLDPVPTSRKIFLYEVSQLSDPDEERASQLRLDLQNFLHLREPISPMIWFKPGMNHTDEKHLERVEKMKIDICYDKYARLRSVLMEQAINASTWIREYFINAEDVVVSSKDYFANTLMKGWEQDPCIKRRKKMTK